MEKRITSLMLTGVCVGESVMAIWWSFACGGKGMQLSGGGYGLVQQSLTRQQRVREFWEIKDSRLIVNK